MARRVRIRLDYRGIGEAMRMQPVRDRLRRRAEIVATKARAIARGEDAPAFADSIRVDDGTRKGGRPYARVIGDHPDRDRYPEALEYGDEHTDRLRILGRAANVEIKD